jgi:hypothetical protein
MSLSEIDIESEPILLQNFALLEVIQLMRVASDINLIKVHEAVVRVHLTEIE